MQHINRGDILTCVEEDENPKLSNNLDMQTHKLLGEGGSDGIYIDSIGNLGIGTTTPAGIQHSILSLTQPALFGGDTVEDIQNASTTATAATLTKAGENFLTTCAAGDLVIVTDSTTAADKGTYRIMNVASDTVLTVDRVFSGTNSDVDFSVVKDVILIDATDGTNGQRIMNYSRQNRPLQIGGETLIVTSHSLSSRDVLISNHLEVKNRIYVDDFIYIGAEKGVWFNTRTTFGGILTKFNDGTHFCVGKTSGYGNRNLIITDSDNYSADHDHDTLSANPTVFIHSVTSPNTDNTQWLSLIHDQTDGIIGLGKGLLNIKPTSVLTNTVLSATRITHETSGTPAAGIGVGLEFEQETAVANNEVIATIEAVATDVTGASEEGSLSLKVMVAGAAATEALKVDSSVAAGETRLLLYDVDNATMERVTVGAADSGGAGFKVLRIPN